MRLPSVANLAFAAVVFIQLGASVSAQSGKHSSTASQNNEPPSLSLRLIDPNHPFPADGRFGIRAELTNVGREPILVCRELRPGGGSIQPCDWQFEIHDSSGQLLTGVGWAADAVVGKRDDFATALVKNRITLPPAYSYSTVIDVGIGFWERPIPGRYEITGILSSYGLDAEIIYNDLKEYPDEIKKLPYRGWKGSISSNELWITIIPSSRKP